MRRIERTKVMRAAHASESVTLPDQNWTLSRASETPEKKNGEKKNGGKKTDRKRTEGKKQTEKERREKNRQRVYKRCIGIERY